MAWQEDGMLGRIIGINTISPETELSKYDLISYNYGYTEIANTIMSILCEGKIPERLTIAIARSIERKTIDKSLVGELYPEDLLSDIGRRDSKDENINIEELIVRVLENRADSEDIRYFSKWVEELPQIVKNNSDYLRGYNSHRSK